jgi:hypothetical protein
VEAVVARALAIPLAMERGDRARTAAAAEPIRQPPSREESGDEE